MTSDLDLLDQYARENSQEAFAALLDRHLKLVYSAALRMVRSPDLAEDVAQSVFCDLARNAGKLEPRTVLTAWLYQVTRRTAIDVVRRESRRQLREQFSLEMTQANSNSSEWTEIEPLLDEAMEALNPPDRAAILLRYFQEKSLREVGQTLGTSEDAAQKRVSRVLEELREFFSKRGRAVGVGALATIIAANAAQSAPAGLKAAVLTAATAAGAVAPIAGTVGITKTLVMTTVQKTLICAALAAAVSVGLYEGRRASEFQEQIHTLKQQPPPNTTEDDSLRHQLDDTRRQLASLQAENEKLRRDTLDLARLRAEVTRLRETAPAPAVDSTGSSANSWLARVSQIKQRLQQTPSARIPEFQFLTDKDWLEAAKDELSTDEDYRRAFGNLRNMAEGALIAKLKPALSQYAQANNGQFPASVDQLQPYFDSPVDESILQRWEVAPKSTCPSTGVGSMILTQVAPVDASYDNRYAVGLNGWGTAGTQDWSPGGSDIEKTLTPALKAYAAANNGLEPTDPSQLTPYLTTPEQQTALQNFIKQHPTGASSARQ